MPRKVGPIPQTAAQIAAEYLRGTDNPAVGWGDTRLLHEIASKLGLSPEGFAFIAGCDE